MNTTTAPDAAAAERRRIGVHAARAFVENYFVRAVIEENNGHAGGDPRWWERCGRMTAFKNIALTCGLGTKVTDDASLIEAPDEMYVREFLQLPELERMHRQAIVQEFLGSGATTTEEAQS